MLISKYTKSYIKGVMYSLLGVMAAALGVLIVGAYGDYFETNPVHATIAFSPSLGIDTFGALIPFIVALGSLMLFLAYTKAASVKFAVSLVVSTACAFVLFHPTANGVAGYTLLFSLIVSMVTTIVNIFPKPFTSLRSCLVASLMLTLACVPFSILIIDVYYSSYYPVAVIGGIGLSDGIVLSTLYTPLSIVAVFSALFYISKTLWLVNKSRIENNVKTESKQVFSKEPN